MTSENLFELVYILLDKKTVTAGQVAEHFGISTRTVYRWVDALALAGIPVYTSRGKSGGISITEDFSLDETVLTEEEKQSVLASLKAVSSLSGEADSAISKLAHLISENVNTDWIEIDFAPWYGRKDEVRKLFGLLKTTILHRQKIVFEYYSAKGEFTKRKVEPWRIIFRGQDWYLYGFCDLRQEPRNFKFTRIRNCRVSGEKNSHFPYDFVPMLQRETFDENTEMVNLKLQVSNIALAMILDSQMVYNIEEIEGNPNEKIIQLKMPRVGWLMNWILGFGSGMKVLEPAEIKNWIKDEISKMNKKVYPF